MKFVYLIIFAVVITACTSNPNITYRAEMGWNTVLSVYQERQQQCFSEGDWINGAFLPDQCPISANEATRANQIVKAYRYYAETFVASSDKTINACQMASLAFKLGNLINESIDPGDVDLFCGDSVDVANMQLALEEAVTL